MLPVVEHGEVTFLFLDEVPHLIYLRRLLFRISLEPNHILIDFKPLWAPPAAPGNLEARDFARW